MSNRYENREADLIQGTIKDMEAAVALLRANRDETLRALEEKEERLAAWKLRLAQLNTGSVLTPSGPRRRRTKGENMREVRSYFENHTDQGCSIAEIAKATGIPWSSVRKTLLGNTENFSLKDDLWYMNRQTKNGNGDGKELHA